MSAVVQTLAWVGAAWMAAAVYVAVAKPFRDEPPHRTPEDVQRDIAEHRARRDLDTCRGIWPDPPTWRVIAAQHRLDTAKQRRKENP
ncbi:hypothetical protein ACPB9J_16060 [Streptomyces lavendulocolor]|uniref:hypothetical protein n=1 Tax=Streptomyces lavendulocolor TaxID=67316 RepID=UPI003C2CD15E